MFSIPLPTLSRNGPKKPFDLFRDVLIVLTGPRSASPVPTADTVTSYVSFCTDSCIPSKSVTNYANDKPWFSKDIKHKFIAKNDAFKNSDKNQYKAAKYEAEKAKAQDRNKLEKQFSTSNSHAVAGPPANHPAFKQKPTPVNNE